MRMRHPLLKIVNISLIDLHSLSNMFWFDDSSYGYMGNDESDNIFEHFT